LFAGWRYQAFVWPHLLLGWFLFSAHQGSFPSQQNPATIPSEKSIAVLPFESLSENKTDAYFADGVQGEILNNLAKIAQLKVVSRTSVMQYRADSKRDLRLIANALGVANVLEGIVRREGNQVRVSTELIDAREDKTIWADSYDRNLTDIFAIQSEVAQTIAGKLAATLSPEEKKRIETKPTENLEAYDLYLRARELTVNARVTMNFEGTEPAEQLREGINFLEQAVRLDPKFTLAYCVLARAQDLPQKSFADTELLSQLAVVDALLGKKQDAITEAKRASEVLPISRDAWSGVGIAANLAVVYAWTDELDLSFETLAPMTKMPFGIHYGDVKVSPYWDPLRQDPRFEKLLAELAPKE
jgi:TolB-like protein